MRVALVCPYDLGVPGGVQSHVRHLAAELRRRDVTAAIVAPGEAASGDRGGPDPVGRAVGIPFNDSVAPVALSPAAAARTRRTLRRLDADVVHVHEPAVPMVSLTASLSAAGPLVGTFHAWSERDRLYRLARPLVRWVTRRLTARVAVSPAARRYHAGALGLDPAALDVVPNGVDTDRFAAAEPFPWAGGRPTILFVGRLEPRKGLEQAVRAFVALRAERDDPRMVVVGEGPERDRCRALLPDGLRDDVSFAGRVDDRALARHLRSCDVYVAPALGGESFGIVLLEAMAAGAPVVASDLPGFRTVLTDGREGRLVPPGEVSALAGALGALLDDPARREAMAAAGRETAAGYDWSRVAGGLLDVYRRVSGG